MQLENAKITMKIDIKRVYYYKNDMIKTRR